MKTPYHSFHFCFPDKKIWKMKRRHFHEIWKNELFPEKLHSFGTKLMENTFPARKLFSGSFFRGNQIPPKLLRIPHTLEVSFSRLYLACAFSFLSVLLITVYFVNHYSNFYVDSCCYSTSVSATAGFYYSIMDSCFGFA